MNSIKEVSIRHVSWGAILAGVILVLAIESLLNLLGLGLGLTVFTVNSNAVSTMGIGSLIWIILSSIVSLFTGAWIASRLAHIHLGLEGALHGLVIWGLTMLLTFILMATTASAFISGMTNILRHVFSLTGQATATFDRVTIQMAAKLPKTGKNLMPDLKPALNEIKQKADQIFLKSIQNIPQATPEGVGEESREEMKTQFQQTVDEFLTSSNNDDRLAARQRLISFLVKNTNMDESEAEKTINDWQQNYHVLKHQIIEETITRTEQASNTLGKFAIIAFCIFLLSAIASLIGGVLGVEDKK